MDETDRREHFEARLYSLYQRYFADLEEDIRKLDPSYRPSDAQTVWPRRFSWQEFQSYLREPVRNSDLRRCFVERVLRFGTAEEQAELREAFGAIFRVLETPEEGTSSRRDAASHSPMTTPHFSTAKKDRATEVK
jgi:hypothetical protein